MPRIPITLVTGFLGSGKSTFINRIIEKNTELKIGLVVNEFGDVQIESQIIQSSGDAIIEMSSGCLCCVVRTDLMSAIQNLLELYPEINYLVVEASGLSDPVPIAQTFLHNDLGGRLRLDSVICIVDVMNFKKHLREYDITYVQLQYADFVLLSKIDIAPSFAVPRVIEMVSEIVPNVRIYEINDELPLDLLIDTSQFDHTSIKELVMEEQYLEEKFGTDQPSGGITPAPGSSKMYDHHHESIESLFFKTRKPLDLGNFYFLLSVLPAAIVRGKGFIFFHGKFEKWLLQLVGPKRDLFPLAWGTDETRQTALVFIGKGFDTQKLEKALESCEFNALASERDKNYTYHTIESLRTAESPEGS